MNCINKIQKKILRKVGKAISDYKLINNNDSVLICLSGGKDSWTLLSVLKKLQQKAPINFQLEAIHINNGYNETDIEKAADKCAEIGIKLHITNSKIDEVIEKNKRKNGSYCSFCARLRRGIIYKSARKNKFNKIALGHNRDDLNQTLIMNMFFSGRIKSMAIKLESDDKTNTIIRPLGYTSEKLTTAYSRNMKFPIIKNNCPHLKRDNQRELIKKLLDKLEEENPGIKNSLFSSQRRITKTHLLK